ncbi:MAG: family 10 glycosylhydrolase [Massilibacteroides sp.]|nr:family 10 glycosylhydrolase [Massilibacteroides sp.]MDD3062200.1 family 10 glycosylhydrolase [Massilibacteroides sp.]MDD4114426.1 family 10 glycosylhydrolase [Massilibacteroides sp.]MDD4659718.1 family 10 glycosylhydrolase [Massilibacteroides sp.]
MFTNHKPLLSVLIIFFITSCSVSRQVIVPVSENPKREFRGAWIQTAFQGEYKEMTPAEMRNSFIKKLDFLQLCGINAIIFQVRPEADAFYKSDIEPWSRFLTGEQGVAPAGNFDPMAFLIEECHKRNMEFHAWLNPYRASTAGNTHFAESHIYHRRPDLFVKYNKQILFDPGIPDNRQFICRVVRDIVSRYDVDAIHMDDYFYPYPTSGESFPDEASFQKYGKSKGYTEARKTDWRRENVNMLIRELKRTILLTKPWVRFGISPFGIYRNKKNTPDGSGSNTNGLQNYDDLYADILRWEKEGWIDYTIPQIYWEIGHPAADYTTLIHWWNENTEGGHLYIGQDVARTMKAGQLTQKMRLARALPNVQGNCFWPANEVLWNNGRVADSLRRHYHCSPALIPAYTNLHDRSPKDVKKLKAEWTEQGYVLHWQAEQNLTNPELASYFVIYCFKNKEAKNLNNPDKIVAMTRDPFFLLPYEDGKEKYVYVVTAVDRFHNESQKGKTKKVKL